MGSRRCKMSRFLRYVPVTWKAYRPRTILVEAAVYPWGSAATGMCTAGRAATAPPSRWTRAADAWTRGDWTRSGKERAYICARTPERRLQGQGGGRRDRHRATSSTDLSDLRICDDTDSTISSAVAPRVDSVSTRYVHLARAKTDGHLAALQVQPQHAALDVECRLGGVHAVAARAQAGDGGATHRDRS